MNSANRSSGKVNTSQALCLLASSAASLAFIFRYYTRGLRVDWDIDSFIAINQSFLKGRSIYIDFFDPKWPHIQYLYWPTALSKSLLVHMLAGWLAIVATGIAITALGGVVSSHRDRSKYWPAIGGCLYIALAPLMPGGNIGHLEVYANLFIAAGLAALALGISIQKSTGKGLLEIAGAIAIGFGAGIRPNLLIPIVICLALLLGLRNRLRIDRKQAILICVSLGVGVLGPFLPYLLSVNGIQLAWAGSVGIISEWNTAMYPQETLLEFLESARIMLSPRVLGLPFIVCLAGMITLSMCGIARSAGSRLEVAVFGVAWVSGLYLSYWKSHIHHHYILMDLFFVCVLLACCEGGLPQRLRRICMLGTMTLIMIVGFYPLRAMSAGDQDFLREERSLETYLKSMPSRRFSAPELVSLHWKSNEDIQTQGIHPVWSIDILSNRLRSSNVARILNLDSDIEIQCQKWISPEVDIAIMTPPLAESCNLDSNQDWEELRLPSQDRTAAFNIYTRVKLSGERG